MGMGQTASTLTSVPVRIPPSLNPSPHALLMMRHFVVACMPLLPLAECIVWLLVLIQFILISLLFHKALSNEKLGKRTSEFLLHF